MIHEVWSYRKGASAEDWCHWATGFSELCFQRQLDLFIEEEIRLLDVWILLSLLDLKYRFLLFPNTKTIMKTSATFWEWKQPLHSELSFSLRIHDPHIVTFSFEICCVFPQLISHTENTQTQEFFSHTHTARMWSCITDFFTYETTKSVVVKSWTIGIINRVVQLLIITYFIGWVFPFILTYF